MFLKRATQITALLSTALLFRFSYAACGPFNFEKEKANIPIVVSGVVLSSEEVILPLKETIKKNSDIFSDDGKTIVPVPAKSANKEHRFSFKITKVEKGYLKEGEVLNFKYKKSNFACPSTQVPVEKEQWQLNISDVDRDNNATPYGVFCSRLGFQIK